jgi:two-component system, OmpR family, sensor kinase
MRGRGCGGGGPPWGEWRDWRQFRDWHRWRHWPQAGLNPIGHYVRARLHRRLFVWFGATILFTSVVVAVVAIAMSGWYGPSWRAEVQRVEQLVGDQFARSWSNPSERDALAKMISDDLEIDVRLEDVDGNLVSSFGENRPCSKEISARIPRSGDRLGTLVLCSERHGWGSHRGAPWHVLIPLAILGSMIWAASGKIARRLARPLAEVARVAHEIGSGKLSSRATPSCRTPDEVGVLADAINDMADRIERQLRDQRELLAAVSHELRTPLGHLQILIELVRTNGADPKTLAELEREVVEIDVLVGELLASSRLDFTALTMKRLDPKDVGRRALERAGIAAERLEVETDRAFEGDATLIARALANLLDNAKRHGGGVTALRVKDAGEGRMAFEVDDHGSGISTGEEEKLFEPFYQSKNGNGHGALGLGLALVKRIAEAHGGSAYAANRPGGGARVGFELPSARA